MALMILIRGGGDLASGVAARLFRAGMHVYITELEQPLAVRRTVSFAQVVYSRSIAVEEIRSCLARDHLAVLEAIKGGFIPVLIDPEALSRRLLKPDVIIDGRMTKKPPDLDLSEASMVIGLGPGFTARINCHAVIETRRGPTLGKVYWHGSADADTGLPESVGNHQSDRVLRAPSDGTVEQAREIGDIIDVGQTICQVSGNEVKAPFRALLRGLIQPGVFVSRHTKIGDLDPRLDPRLCYQISDKALAIGGGVTEAILSKVDLRKRLCE